MKLHGIITCVLVGALGVVAFQGHLGCVTDPATGQVHVDLGTLATELELGAGTARDASAVVEDPGFAETLEKLATSAETIAGALRAADGGGMDVGKAIDAALALSDQALDQASSGDSKAAIILLRDVLRRVKAYLPPVAG